MQAYRFLISKKQSNWTFGYIWTYTNQTLSLGSLNFPVSTKTQAQQQSILQKRERKTDYSKSDSLCKEEVWFLEIGNG